jgi:ankyrin repeat protein
VLKASTSARNGWLPAHAAAHGGHASCIAVISECGAGDTLSALTTGGDLSDRTPAMLASMGGHDECLAVLATHGGPAALCKENSDGWTPSHFAAEYGHDACLAVLAKSRAVTTFFFPARHNSSATPPMAAAHATCLSVLAAKTARDVHEMEVEAWESCNPEPDIDSDGWRAWYHGQPQRSDKDATPATAAARESHLEKLMTRAAADARELKAVASRKKRRDALFALIVHTIKFREHSMCVTPTPFATSDARVNIAHILTCAILWCERNQ